LPIAASATPCLQRPAGQVQYYPASYSGIGYIPLILRTTLALA
jgi:hypothetical protein